jgi:hypothetical protein
MNHERSQYPVTSSAIQPAMRLRLFATKPQSIHDQPQGASTGSFCLNRGWLPAARINYPDPDKRRSDHSSVSKPITISHNQKLSHIGWRVMTASPRVTGICDNDLTSD